MKQQINVCLSVSSSFLLKSTLTKVKGENLLEFIRQEVFAPFGKCSSSDVVGSEATPPVRSSKHRAADREEVRGDIGNHNKT